MTVALECLHCWILGFDKSEKKRELGIVRVDFTLIASAVNMQRGPLQRALWGDVGRRYQDREVTLLGKETFPQMLP